MELFVDVPKAEDWYEWWEHIMKIFFPEPDASSLIGDIYVDLIKRFGVILEVISSGFAINAEKFSSYEQTTAMLHVELYGWHPMSLTVQKVLVHGTQVKRQAILFFGQSTEEAAKARNKSITQYRIGFSRKFSREYCNWHIMNRLLLSSDLHLSSITPKTQRKNKTIFSKEALDLMIVIVPSSLTDESTSCKNDKENEDNEVHFYFYKLKKRI